MQLDHTPSDTRHTLELLPVPSCSRSLFFDRFAQPELKDEKRKQFFLGGCKAHRANEKMTSWKKWLQTIDKDHGVKILFAKLQSRLMVNMAGGVMENAGLCLDRFGVPYVPGSAVKGCARRMAIQNLLEARESKEANDKLARLLADIALIFGWGQQDWKADKAKNERLKSDFVYAVGETLWPQVGNSARKLLPNTNDFGGIVSFLPAYPHQLPANDLELDIVTCHHPKYYEGKMPIYEGKMPALDTEDLIPVVFPAVAAGIVIRFAVLPLRGKRDSLSQPGTQLHLLALEWLRHGLETFGLGAKTAAGYGWFEASEDFNRKMVEQEVAEDARLQKQKEDEAEKLRQRRQEEERIKQREEKKQAFAKLTSEQQEDYNVAHLTPDQFRAKLDNFPTNKVETEKQAIVRALRLDAAAADSRRTFWDELKAKALKKRGKFVQIELSIRQISNQLKLGKMP
jgi:CRISPR type III-B/RAMP module RAMP protein Cmr6